MKARALSKSLSGLKGRVASKSPDYSTVYFRGGLGSQILQMIEFLNRKKLKHFETLLDTEYFEDNRIFQEDSGLTHWKWELEHYGISLPSSSRKLASSWKLRPLSDLEHIAFIRKHNLLQITNEIIDFFPILSSPKIKMRTIFSSEQIENFGVIHIRKGDYLKVATKIFGIKEIITLLTRIGDILPPDVVILSDGVLSEREKDSLGLKLKNPVFIDSTNNQDKFLAHDLMREARVLITGNSTFSFSAALLNNSNDAKIFFPTDWYGVNGPNWSSVFQDFSDFAILK